MTRPTFDELRDENTPRCPVCHRRVTGTCRAVLPVQCRHARVPSRGGRVYGAIMPDLDSGEGE